MVMFTAYVTLGGDFKENETIVFGTVVTNIGDGYSNSSGTFTCPVDGYYVFQLHLGSLWKKNAIAYILANDKIVGHAFFSSGEKHVASVTLLLERGDKVRITSAGNSHVLGDVSIFTGYLLSLK